MDRIVILDCETGGLDENRHSLISIALCKITSDFTVIDKVEYFISLEEYVVTPKAMFINRIDLGDAENWLKPDVVKKKMLEFLDMPANILEGVENKRGRWRIFGKNPDFDAKFLKVFFGPKVYDSIFMHWTECVLKDMYNPLERQGLVPVPAKRSLGDLCEIMGIELDKDKLHGAAYDVEMTLMLAQKLSKIEKWAKKVLAKAKLDQKALREKR